jgi:hypothetical protein
VLCGEDDGEGLRKGERSEWVGMTVESLI